MPQKCQRMEAVKQRKEKEQKYFVPFVLYKFLCENLWCDYRSDTFRKLRVAYNDSYRILHNLCRYVSARECQVSAHVTTSLL